MGDFYPAGDATMFATHVFNAYDKDGNGEVDFREFTQALSVTRRGSKEEKLAWIFSLYDLDNSGTVTKEEMVDVFIGIYEMIGHLSGEEEEVTPKEMVERIFVDMDSNNDGVLSLEEFLSGASEHPTLESLLKNSSGSVQTTTVCKTVVELED